MERSILLILLSVLIFSVISFVPYHHWDEYHYLFSLMEHSPQELIEIETDLANRIFPEGFFSSKLGFLFLLKVLMLIFGEGILSIFAIQLVFSVIVIGFAITGYFLIREIEEPSGSHHLFITILFMPVTVYLSHKILSESPALLLTTLGSWMFLKGVKSRGTWQSGLWHLCSIMSIFLGFICRFNAFLLFVGLILGLLFRADKRFPRRVVFQYALLVSVGVLILYIVFLLIFGIPLDRSIGLFTGLVSRRRGFPLRIYSIVLSIQFFLPALLLSISRPWDPMTRMGFIWLGVCVLPIIIGIRWIEPRYFEVALLPLAILIYRGLLRLAKIPIFTRYRVGWLHFLILVVLGNRLIFAQLMPYEVHQQDYVRIISHLSQKHPEPSYLIPWLSDYAFLSYAFPQHRIRFALSNEKLNDPAYFLSPGFEHWVGKGNYVGGLDTLTRLPHPWIYIGWTFNPAVIHLRDLANSSGVPIPQSIEELEGLRNHLEQSWIWNNPALELSEVAQLGQYHAFIIKEDDSITSSGKTLSSIQNP